MSAKIIYFVRHGETELNAKNIRQGPDGPLSAKGLQQVRMTAVRLPKKKSERPEVIISSPFQRAKETAAIFAQTYGMNVEYTPLLEERKNPTEIIGHAGSEPSVQAIIDRIDKSYHEDSLRISDEENFIDLRNRARDLLEYIAKRPEKRILMVTHGIFLKMVVSYMLLGKALTSSEYNKLSYLNPMDNAGVTICTYKKPLIGKPKWKLLMWNDTFQKEDVEE